MTSREKTLLMISLGAVAAGILFVGYAFVYAPLTDAWERHDAAKEALKMQRPSTDGNLKVMA